MRTPLPFTLLAAALAFGSLAQGAPPAVKVLAAAEDATKKTVLIGRNVAEGMVVTLEIEGAEWMRMPMGNPPKWSDHPVAKGDLYHLEVKPVDPKSGTRISYAVVKFSAVNRDTRKTVAGTMNPSWGSSGLHYAANSPLAGDGTYETTITVGVPAFGRVEENKDAWMKPAVTTFHLKIAGGKVVEVSEPVAEAKK